MLLLSLNRMNCKKYNHIHLIRNYSWCWWHTSADFAVQIGCFGTDGCKLPLSFWRKTPYLPSLPMQSLIFTHNCSSICVKWRQRYCSPPCCTGAYNVQAMFKITSERQERERAHHGLIFLGCLLLLRCFVIMHATGTRQVIYTVECVAQLPWIFWLVQLLF